MADRNPAQSSSGPQSPSAQPPSPTLRPQSRPPPASRSQRSGQSGVTDDHVPSSATDASSAMPEVGATTPRSLASPSLSGGGRGDGSSSSSRSSNDGGSTGPRADLTASVISTLDLDAEPSAAAADAETPAESEETEQAPRPPPLVREDTSTREAMAQVDFPAQETHSDDPIQLVDHTSGSSISSASTPSGAPTGLDFGTSDSSTQDAGLKPEPEPAQEHSFDSYYWQPDGHASSDAATDADADASGDPAPHDPKTTASRSHEPETVPTVSATGMPRMFLPRETEDPQHQGHVGSEGPPPPEMLPEGEAPAPRRYANRPRRHHRRARRTSSSSDESVPSSYFASDADADSDSGTESRPGSGSGSHRNNASQPKPTDAPTGSLTLAALSPSSNLSLARRASLLSASLLINLGLPFVNGVMLGFGEIFARSVVAPVVLGFIGRNWGVGLGLGTGGAGLGVGAAGGGSGGGATGQRERDREVMRDVAGSGRGVGSEGVGARAVS